MARRLPQGMSRGPEVFLVRQYQSVSCSPPAPIRRPLRSCSGLSRTFPTVRPVQPGNIYADIRWIQQPFDRPGSGAPRPICFFAHPSGALVQKSDSPLTGACMELNLIWPQSELACRGWILSFVAAASTLVLLAGVNWNRHMARCSRPDHRGDLPRPVLLDPDSMAGHVTKTPWEKRI
jgi:hypothetical protein